MNPGWSQGAGDGEAPERAVCVWTLTGAEERFEASEATAAGAEAELAALGDPAFAFRRSAPPEDGPAYVVRPTLLAGAPTVLVSCWQRGDGAERAETRAFAAADVVAAGPSFFTRVPAQFGTLLDVNESSAEDREAALDALALLLAPGGEAGPIDLEARDATTFWRRVGAVAEAAPRALLPLFSAAWSAGAGAPAIFAAAPGAGSAAGRRASPSAARRRAEAALTTLASAATSSAASAVPAIFRRWPMEPSDAPSRLLDELRAVVATSAPVLVAEVDAFLTTADAPPPAPADDPTERALQIARAAAAADAAAAGREDATAKARLDPMGAARAVSLLALEAEAESAAAWSAVAALEPGRGCWSAVAIADPGFDGLGVGSLRELAQIFSADHLAREALPPNAPTPLDGSRFKKATFDLLNEFGARFLSHHPDFLLDETGRSPAPWLKRALAIWADVNDVSKRRLAQTVDAIEAAARLTGDRTAWRSAISLVRATVFVDRGPDENARDLQLESTALGRDFGRRLGGALQANALSGVLFWRRALRAAFEKVLAEAPSETGTLHRYTAQALGDDSPVRRHVMRVIDAPATFAPGARIVDAPVERPAVEREVEAPRRKSTIGAMVEEAKAQTEAALPAVTAAAPEPSVAAPRPEAAEAPKEAPEEAPKQPLSEPPAEPPAAEALSAADALHSARAAVERWRARFAKAVGARRDGGAAEPLAFSAEGDDAADLDALEALCAAVVSEDGRRAPELVDAAIGPDLGWTARQLLGLRDEWKARAPHEPAPEPVKAAWRMIGAADREGPLAGSELFFLFFATKLLQRAERAQLDPDPIAEPFLKLLQNPSNPIYLGRRARVQVTPYEGWLRDYIYLARRRETEADLDKLDDAAVEARLDRAMFFLALVTCAPEDARQAPATDLWDPIFRSQRKEALAVNAPQSFFGRLERFFSAEAPERETYVRAFEKITSRNRLYLLPDISSLNRLMVRLMKEKQGGQRS